VPADTAGTGAGHGARFLESANGDSGCKWFCVFLIPYMLTRRSLRSFTPFISFSFLRTTRLLTSPNSYRLFFVHASLLHPFLSTHSLCAQTDLTSASDWIFIFLLTLLFQHRSHRLREARVHDGPVPDDQPEQGLAVLCGRAVPDGGEYAFFWGVFF
jgi:hypothetical protein